MIKVSWFASLVVSLLVVSQSSADIVLSTPNDLSFVQDSGVQQINVFVRTTTGTDLGTVSLSTFLSVAAPSGSFVEVSSPNGFADLTGPFSFQNSTFLGNTVAGGASSDIDPGDVRNAFVGFEFNSPQTFLTTPTFLGSFNFDVTGLAPGLYSLAFTPDAGTAASLASVGSITITTAVPEPSSVLMIVGAGLISACYVRRSRSIVTGELTAA